MIKTACDFNFDCLKINSKLKKKIIQTKIQAMDDSVSSAPGMHFQEPGYHMHRMDDGISKIIKKNLKY